MNCGIRLAVTVDTAPHCLPCGIRAAQLKGRPVLCNQRDVREDWSHLWVLWQLEDACEADLRKPHRVPLLNKDTLTGLQRNVVWACFGVHSMFCGQHETGLCSEPEVVHCTLQTVKHRAASIIIQGCFSHHGNRPVYHLCQSAACVPVFCLL